MNYIEKITTDFVTLNKKSLTKSVDYLYKSIEEDVIPSLESIIESGIGKLIKSPYVKSSLGILNTSKDIKKSFIEIKNFYLELLGTESFIKKLVSDFRDIIPDKVVYVKEATALRFLGDFNFLTLYILDYIYIVLIEADHGETIYPKIKIKSVKEEFSKFSILFNYYNGNTKKLFEELGDLPEVKIGEVEKTSQGFIDTFMGKFKFINNLPVTNFYGNPIYHFRMWMVDREMKKYEALKEKKREVEMKLLDLKYKEQGIEDDSIKKQVTYYENKLSRIEYEIVKIEKD